MNWKKTTIQVLWLLLGVVVIVLLGAAMTKKNNKYCSDIKVEITGAEEHLFIDEKDVLQLISGHEIISSKKVNEINLKAIEAELEKTPWVKNAELFFDNKQVLQVRIEERQPIARVFTAQGNSFYIDSAGTRLPLSEKLSARVPMFTNFPSDKKVMAGSDSLLLKGVVNIGKYITADSFWNAQIEQIDITPQATFEIIPTIGNQTIVFGDATDVESKFTNLYTFYKKAWLQNGINTYEKLDVQYKNQVVAVKRGTVVPVADTAKAKANLNALMTGSLVLLNSSDNPTSATKADSIAAIKPADKKKLIPNLVINNKKTNNTFSIIGKANPIIKKGKQPLKRED